MDVTETKRALQKVNERLEDILAKFPDQLPSEYELVEQAQTIITEAIDGLANEEE